MFLYNLLQSSQFLCFCHYCRRQNIYVQIFRFHMWYMVKVQIGAAIYYLLLLAAAILDFVQTGP